MSGSWTQEVCNLAPPQGPYLPGHSYSSGPTAPLLARSLLSQSLCILTDGVQIGRLGWVLVEDSAWAEGREAWCSLASNQEEEDVQRSVTAEVSTASSPRAQQATRYHQASSQPGCTGPSKAGGGGWLAGLQGQRWALTKSFCLLQLLLGMPSSPPGILPAVREQFALLGLWRPQPSCLLSCPVVAAVGHHSGLCSWPPVGQPWVREGG